MSNYCSIFKGYVTIITIWLSQFVIKVVSGSYGDRSYKFQQCYKQCIVGNCSDLIKFHSEQPIYEDILQWSCKDECKYTCMWITVDAFQKDNLAVPQFYGKWPFVRLLGIQEPASVIFSILNALAHLSIIRYRQHIPKSTHMYYLWHFFSLVGLNAWFWSVIFHSKDTAFTEMMDYFCAFSLVLTSLFAFLCRAFGSDKPGRIFLFGVTLLTVYVQHIYYLAFVKFDYGYNMKVNVAVGILNVIGWLLWSCYMYFRKKQIHVWKCISVTLGTFVLLALELWDFPPLLWTFDAHSLWHAGTAPLGFLWYSFVIDDGKYLVESSKEPKKD